MVAVITKARGVGFRATSPELMPLLRELERILHDSLIVLPEGQALTEGQFWIAASRGGYVTLDLGPVGTLVRSNGTRPAYTVFTIPATFVAGDLLHASAANTVTGLPIGAVPEILVVSGAGFPAWERWAPTGYISGGGLSFLTVSTVTLGASGFPSQARDSTDVFTIRWTGLLTANITASGANGLDAGSEAADTWYAVHVIGDEGGVQPTASLLSTSATAPTLPAGYTVFRRVGWARNNGLSNFLRFTQTCDGPVRHYEYDEDRTVLQVLAGGNAILFATVSMVSLIPPDSRDALLAVGLDPQTVNDGLRLRPTGSAVLEVNAVVRLTPGVTQQVDMLPTRVMVGASQDIDYAVTSAATLADIYVVGFVDHI